MYLFFKSMLWEFSQILGDIVPNFKPRRFFTFFGLKLPAKESVNISKWSSLLVQKVEKYIGWPKLLKALGQEHKILKTKVVQETSHLVQSTSQIQWGRQKTTHCSPSRVYGSLQYHDNRGDSYNILNFLYKKTYGSMSSSNWAIWRVGSI